MTFANRASFILVCITLAFTTLAYGAVHQPVIALFYLVVAVLAVLWGIDTLRSGFVRTPASLLQIPLYAAAAYGLFQVIPFGYAETAGVAGIPRTISHDPFWTQVAAMHFFALGLFFSLTLVLLDSSRRIRLMAGFLTVFGFGYAFFAVLQSVLSPDKIYGIYDALAPFGSFVNRHNFAAAMEMFIAVPLGMLFMGAVRPDKRLLYITAIALMGAALLLSGSRGGLVAFLASLIFLVLITARGSGAKKLALRVAMSVLLLGAVVIGAIFVGGDTSLTRVAETSAAKDVTTGRFDIWNVSMQVIAENMPFGAGLGAFGVAYTPFDPTSGLARVEQAHNDYLQILADAGIPGLLIALGFLYLLFHAGKRGLAARDLTRRGIAAGALAGIFAVLVHSLFDFTLHTTAVSVIFVTLLAVLSAAGHEYPDDAVEHHGDEHRRRRRSSRAQIEPFRR